MHVACRLGPGYRLMGLSPGWMRGAAAAHATVRATTAGARRPWTGRDWPLQQRTVRSKLLTCLLLHQTDPTSWLLVSFNLLVPCRSRLLPVHDAGYICHFISDMPQQGRGGLWFRITYVHRDSGLKVGVACSDSNASAPAKQTYTFEHFTI